MEENIPRNIDETGGVFGGLFETRNTVEAIIVSGIIILFFKLFTGFLPFTIRIILGASLAFVSGFVFLQGINNQPVSIVLLDSINFRKTRRIVVLRMPMPEERPVERKKRKIKIKRKRRK